MLYDFGADERRRAATQISPEAGAHDRCLPEAVKPLHEIGPTAKRFGTVHGGAAAISERSHFVTRNSQVC